MVGSRAASDRHALHRRLREALAETNERSRPTTPFAITVGDEFQGACARLGDALHSTFRIVLALAPDFEVRFGIGWGEVTALDDDGIEDGPGWWSAREAIIRVHATQSKSSTRSIRTEFEPTPGSLPDSTVALVRGALLLRDHALSLLDPTSLQILHGRIDGRTQAQVAERLKITPSAVSQRVLRDGLNVVLRAEEQLMEVS